MAHEKGARLVPRIQRGDAVYARNFPQGPLWVPATVSSIPSDNITDVTLPHERCWRRHQGDLRPHLGQAVVPLEPEEQAVPPAEVMAPQTVTVVLPDPAVDESARAPEAVESQQGNSSTTLRTLSPQRSGRSRNLAVRFTL